MVQCQGWEGPSDGLCEDECSMFGLAEHEDRDACATGRFGFGCQEEALALIGTTVVSSMSLPLKAG